MQKGVIFDVFNENRGHLKVAEEVPLFFHFFHDFVVRQVFFLTISNAKR